MNEFLLALGIVLVLEGIGPMLFPKRWRAMLLTLMQQPAEQLRTFGGVLVTIGLVTIFMMAN